MKTITVLLMGFIGFINLSQVKKSPKKNPERVILLNKVFNLLEEKAANPNWVKSKEYKSFKKLMYSKKTMRLNESDFLKLFRKHRHDLPFSHFDLYSKRSTNTVSVEEKQEEDLYWKEVNKKTAYLRIKTFVISGAPMVKIVSEIGTDNYENLIIDLRGNGGGSLDAAVVLGKFLTQSYIDAGVYLNRSWFTKNNRYATKKDIEKMPFLKDFTYEGIHKMYKNTDAFRMVIPPHQNPIFKGKVFVMMNDSSASTCEPLIDLFKKMNIATLVGYKSAGNMLSGQNFKIDDNYTAFIPIADYQTADGTRIDQVGIAPDYEIFPGDAFRFIMDELIK